ncbi:hypothetical protein CCS01_03515 [Rhodopila globiformis]|uniref:Uncharacterized protein n=1 Tax=Rhodopila globiformis TaxID=1071 RepID=A0A2S6NMM3_RHOGL|nr:hypothetical protein CCS01_03515 [Rhodopila globiformis]
MLVLPAACAAWDAVKSVTGSVAEGFAGDKVKAAGRTLKSRVAARLPLPANHDLLLEIRMAELTAADKVRQAYTAYLGRLPEREVDAADRCFAEAITAFLSARLKPHTSGSIDLESLTPERIAHVLDTMIDATAEGAAPGRPPAHAHIEAAFLADIEQQTACRATTIFQDCFYGRTGDAPAPSWYDMVALYVTEALKTNERFRSIFFAAEFVDLKQLIVALDARIATFLDRGVPSLLEALRDIKNDTAATRAIATDIHAKVENTHAKVENLEALVRQLLAQSASQPMEQRAVAAAVTDIARQSDAGDTRLARALDLLAQDRIAEAEALLQSVADEKAARIREDTRDAIAAYRNLGAIAGLRDPARALDHYEKALALDPDDRDSLLWAAWIQNDRGDRANAKARFDRLLALAADDPDSWHAVWSLIGSGNVLLAEGARDEALAAYRQSRDIAQRLAEKDPGNAGWHVDLLWSHWRLARQGDDACRRWGLIVNGLKALAANNRLTTYQAGFLPVAEAELRKCDEGPGAPEPARS